MLTRETALEILDEYGYDLNGTVSYLYTATTKQGPRWIGVGPEGVTLKQEFNHRDTVTYSRPYSQLDEGTFRRLADPKERWK